MVVYKLYYTATGILKELGRFFKSSYAPISFDIPGHTRASGVLIMSGEACVDLLRKLCAVITVRED